MGIKKRTGIFLLLALARVGAGETSVEARVLLVSSQYTDNGDPSYIDMKYRGRSCMYLSDFSHSGFMSQVYRLTLSRLI